VKQLERILWKLNPSLAKFNQILALVVVIGINSGVGARTRVGRCKQNAKEIPSNIKFECM